MKISEILTTDGIVLLSDTPSKRQLLQDLTTMAAAVSGIEARTLFDVVLERENLGSTGFGKGIALPHARIPGLKKVTGVFAKLKNAVDFGAADNNPVDLVFLLLSPENSGADHLTALAQISRIIKDDTSCKKIRSASSTEEIYKILNAA